MRGHMKRKDLMDLTYQITYIASFVGLWVQVINTWPTK